jgi:hypothetical protein
VYKQILINAELKIGKRGKKTELLWRSPLRRRRSVLDCSAIEEEEEEEEEDDDEEEKKKKMMMIRRKEEEEDMAHGSYYLGVYIYTRLLELGLNGRKSRFFCTRRKSVEPTVCIIIIIIIIITIIIITIITIHCP